ncbi:SAM-dependent methyltransferase [Pseudonocardia spinosispora]|uniref:SAM-dependent methyltransferase n=1 Tax=Pseudonocardia spinosispora TaxID=103441 RepID=UPI001B7FEE56|nr:class I SAM-dependent methyltransferase [Pseudonocardia spinosispora]
MINSPSRDWHHHFFTELPNEFWRRVVPPEATLAEVDFVEHRLGLAPGSRVLDVPCGSGRHTLELARRGHRVTGIDISTEAIDHARRITAGFEVELSVGEMTDVPADGRFDAAICLGNSFGYFPLAETRRLISALAAALRPGGGLVIDLGTTAESLLPGFTAGAEVMETGDIRVSASREYDVITGLLVTEYEFSRGPQRRRASAPYYIRTTAHLIELLTDGGFADVRCFGDPDGSPYELGDRRLLLTAAR